MHWLLLAAVVAVVNGAAAAVRVDSVQALA
jgi:hypothetical protein